MFNWFKSKVELKKDTSIMSSFYNKNGLKLGSEIIVPNNFELLVFHNGKYYNTLTSGKYKMDKKTCLELIENQQKHKSSLKYIKCVCHYVNTSTQKLEIRFKKQNYMIEFIIDNPVNFSSLALLYAYKVDNDYTLTILNELFYELLLYHKGDYKQIKSNSLADYGIIINSFLPSNHKVSIFSTSNNQSTQNTSKPIFGNPVNNHISSTTSQATNLQAKTQEPTSNNQNEVANIANTQSQSQTVDEQNQNQTAKFPACPKCGHIAKFNTTYCLRCGYKLQ